MPEFAPVTRAFWLLRGFSGSGAVFTQMNRFRTIVFHRRKGKPFRFPHPQLERHGTSYLSPWVPHDLNMRLAPQIQGDETFPQNSILSDKTTFRYSQKTYETHNDLSEGGAAPSAEHFATVARATND